MITATPTPGSLDSCCCCADLFFAIAVIIAVFTLAVKPKISSDKISDLHDSFIRFGIPNAKVDNTQVNYKAPNTSHRVKWNFRHVKRVTPQVKGAEFEKFVMDKFHHNDFAIVEMTHKFAGLNERFVESNLNPDFVFRHKVSGDVFAVEAKFRSGLNEDGLLEWSNFDQLERYNRFAEEKGIPVYVVIGLGGKPKNPRELICIPLKEAKYPQLYPSIYKKYTRNVFTNFYWINGSLN